MHPDIESEENSSPSVLIAPSVHECSYAATTCNTTSATVHRKFQPRAAVRVTVRRHGHWCADARDGGRTTIARGGVVKVL